MGILGFLFCLRCSYPELDGFATSWQAANIVSCNRTSCVTCTLYCLAKVALYGGKPLVSGVINDTHTVRSGLLIFTSSSRLFLRLFEMPACLLLRTDAYSLVGAVQ